MDSFALATLILVFVVLLLFMFIFLSGFGNAWFNLKLKFGRKRDYGLIFRFTKNGVCKRYVGKVPDEVTTNKDPSAKRKEDGTIGTKILNPQHHDQATGLPMYFIFDGDFTSQDFRDLFVNNHVLKQALQYYPAVANELKKIPVGDGESLFEYVISVDTSKKIPKNKMEDILNTLYVRAYQLGLLKGRKDVKNGSLGGFLPLILIGLALCAAIVAAYYGYTNHSDIVSLKSSIAAISAKLPAAGSGTVIIPGA